jgi:hypothetical protein
VAGLNLARREQLAQPAVNLALQFDLPRGIGISG